MSKRTKYILLAVAALAVLILLSCDKSDRALYSQVMPQGAVQCDSLYPVEWGDTLKVVKPGYRNISKGVFKGKTYWQAIVYSDQYIEPSKFKNTPTTHRVVVADTLEITEQTLIYITRIK